MQPANYPFLLDSRGRIHYYEPDTLNVYNLRIYRKYPAEFRMVGVASHMIGGEFQAADNPEFKNAIVLHRIEEKPIWIICYDSFGFCSYKVPLLETCLSLLQDMGILQNYNFGGNGELLNPSGKIIGDGWYVGK